jgi:hypothetical protein
MIAGTLLVGMAVPATAAASGSWSVVPSPNVGPNGTELLSDSCLSASFCMATGFYLNSRSGLWPAAERWDGQRWSVVPAPELGPPAEDNVMSAISCTATTACMAVGSSGDSALAMDWDGRQWSGVHVPAGDDELNAIACTSADACVAAGWTEGGTHQMEALAERWDGTNWTVMAVPDPGPASQYSTGGEAQAELTGVSCTSPQWCMAVGTFTGAHALSERALSERWDGTKWSLGSSPAGLGSAPEAVSCTSAVYCLAVGSGPQLESWDGARWSPVTSAYKNPPHDSGGLAAVSCYAFHSCVAVGYEGLVPSGSGCCRAPLVESWDGSKTSVVPAHYDLKYLAGLAAVSCAPTGPCVAVGSIGQGAPGARSLIEMS